MKKALSLALVFAGVLMFVQNATAHHNQIHTKMETGKTEKEKKE